ncbi:MAG: hypothetical protein BWY85_00009 [Firmicutes bacterium ADurb.Bin506]|nr:MAG: hypothetical protein BWY85_00009 [Firmicutes bacterium ADurb.Bin506]
MARTAKERQDWSGLASEERTSADWDGRRGGVWTGMASTGGAGKARMGGAGSARPRNGRKVVDCGGQAPSGQQRQERTGSDVSGRALSAAAGLDAMGGERFAHQWQAWRGWDWNAEQWTGLAGMAGQALERRPAPGIGRKGGDGPGPHRMASVRQDRNGWLRRPTGTALARGRCLCSVKRRFRTPVPRDSIPP